MALEEPVVIYEAATNGEAQMVANALNETGVEAFVTEDNSPVGLWMGGTIPGIHIPRVYVERGNESKARAIVQEYQKRVSALQAKEIMQGDLTIVCEACERPSEYPASQNGSVQECPHCGCYVDVGEEELPEGWEEASEDEERS